jgi:excisionase family DNA binding protein
MHQHEDRERTLTAILDSQLFASAPEAAEILRVDRRTLYKALEAGEVPGFKTGVWWKIPTSWLRERAGMGDRDAASA